MRELELKLSVDEPFRAPPLSSADVGVCSLVEEFPTLDLRAVYYDTPDLRLARRGITLRHRTGEGKPRWTLKLPESDGDVSARDEQHFPGDRRSIPAEATDLLTAFVRKAPLVPVTQLRTNRRRWSLRGREGQQLAELADDRVSVLQRDRVSKRFRELEVEGRELDRNGLERIAAVFEAAGATPGTMPKALRALGARANGSAEFAPATALTPSDPVALFVQAALAKSVERLLRNDPGARLGGAEAVHQMRVAARRLRSHLGAFEPFVDEGWSEHLRAELRWLGGALGPVRDLDVLTARIRAEGDLEHALGPLFGFLSELRAEARVAMGDALRSARYVDLLERLVEAARAPLVADSAWQSAGRSLRPLTRKIFRKLADRGSLLEPQSPLEEFHRVRILAKRARYVAEATLEGLKARDRRQAAAFESLAKDTQAILGELSDAVACSAMLADYSQRHESNPAVNLAVGRLLERQERGVAETRAQFWKCWRGLERRSWFAGTNR